MNSSATNVSPACFYSSIGAILDQADAGKLNVTQLAQQCPNICSLSWGTGNPDLSGIGTNVSYIFQAALLFVFGPVGCLLWAFRKQLRFKDKNLISLLDTFSDVNAAFSIPVAIAAIVRLKQHAPFFEITFLESLLTMQFIGMIAICCVSIVPERENVDDASSEDIIGRWILTAIYLILELGLYAGFEGGLRTSKVNWTSIGELSQACKGYAALTPGFAYLNAGHLNVPSVSAKDFFNPFSTKGWKSDLIITGIVLGALVGLCIVFMVISGTIAILATRNPAIFGVISGGLWIGVLYYTIAMERKRHIMHEVTGADFADNQWGFGQVIALLLWAPLIFQILYYIFNYSVRTCGEKSHDGEAQHYSAPTETSAKSAQGGVIEVTEIKDESADEEKKPAENSSVPEVK